MTELPSWWVLTTPTRVPATQARLNIAGSLAIDPFRVRICSSPTVTNNRVYVAQTPSSMMAMGNAPHHLHRVSQALAAALSHNASTLNALAAALFGATTPLPFQIGRPVLVCADVSREKCALTNFTELAWRLYRMPGDADRRLAYDTYVAAHDWLRSLAESYEVPVSASPGCVLSLAAGGRLR